MATKTLNRQDMYLEGGQGRKERGKAISKEQIDNAQK